MMRVDDGGNVTILASLFENLSTNYCRSTVNNVWFKTPVAVEDLEAILQMIRPPVHTCKLYQVVQGFFKEFPP